MKKLLVFIVAVFLSLSIIAQPPGNPSGGGNFFQTANSGHVYGKVIDSLGKPSLAEA